MDEVVCNIVLDSRAVTNSIDRAQRSSVEAEMSVCFKSVLVCLDIKLIRDAFAKVGLSWLALIIWVLEMVKGL